MAEDTGYMGIFPAYRCMVDKFTSYELDALFWYLKYTYTSIGIGVFILRKIVYYIHG